MPPSTSATDLEARLAASEERAAALAVELDEMRAEVQLLHEVASGVAAAPTTEAMLDYIAETAIRVTGTDSASIYILDETKGELVLRAVKAASAGAEVHPDGS